MQSLILLNFYIRNEINRYFLSSHSYHHMHRSSASETALLMEYRAGSLIGVMVGPQSKVNLVVLCTLQQMIMHMR